MPMEAPAYTTRVCVVIRSPGISEDELRSRLGGSLPLKFTSWDHRAYMSAIRNLRPQVIVVAASDEIVRDFAALLSALLDSEVPTIAIFALALERLSIQQLGASAQAYIHSLDDLLVE
jgi:hypothetical protein